jgi:hypothetical protein
MSRDRIGRHEDLVMVMVASWRWTWCFPPKLQAARAVRAPTATNRWRVHPHALAWRFAQSRSEWGIE